MKSLSLVVVIFLLFYGCSSKDSERRHGVDSVDQARESISTDSVRGYPPADTTQTATESPKNEDSTAAGSMNQNDFNLQRDHSNEQPKN